MKGKKKKATKPIGKLEKYALSYKKAQQRARDFVESMPKNFVLSEDMMKRIYSEAPERLTKKKADEMKRIISKPFLKRNATMIIGRWNKVVSYTDIDPEGNRITGDMPVTTDSQWGKLDSPVETIVSYDTWQEAKNNPNKDSVKLAKSLNKMLDFQRSHFTSTEGKLKKQLWDLAKSLMPVNEKGDPLFPGEYEAGSDADETKEKKKAAYDNQYFKLVKFWKNGKMVEYRPDYNNEAKSAEEFWKAVRWKKLPGWVLESKEFKYIVHHPQTNYDLYEQYLESASLRSVASNVKQMMKSIQNMTQMPVPAIRILLKEMETSQAWNIALRGVDPSEDEGDYSQQDNWKHIGMDLYLLERVPNTQQNLSAIDKIISGIRNEADWVNVKSIMEETIKILASNGIKEYKNNGAWHYDPEKDPYAKKKG